MDNKRWEALRGGRAYTKEEEDAYVKRRIARAKEQDAFRLQCIDRATKPRTATEKALFQARWSSSFRAKRVPISLAPISLTEDEDPSP